MNNKVEFEITEDGDKIWLKDGKIHREDGPAIEYKNGSKSWLINDVLHRVDGPAYEYPNGDKYWYQNGKLHRENGPACEKVSENTNEWFIEGKLHREDGPAIENKNKILGKHYFLDGQEYPFNTWKLKVEKREAMKKHHFNPNERIEKIRKQLSLKGNSSTSTQLKK